MSKAEPASPTPDPIRLFAALGDPTRLELIARLRGGAEKSIVQMGEGLPITRQAVAKHLDVLHQAGWVQRRKAGREVHFALHRQAIEDAHLWLDRIGAQWDETLARLQAFVED